MPSRQVVLTIALLLSALLAYLAGNGRTPLFDRDEPRYALTSRNMLTSGDYVVPRQYDKARTAKPPLVYWAQATAMRVFGAKDMAGTFSARLPSTLALWVTVVLLLLFLRRETEALTGLLAGAILATTALSLFLAKAAITDALLLLFTAVSWWSVYRVWRGDRSWAVFTVGGVALGLAFLTKGPITLGVMGATLAALGALTLLDQRLKPLASWKTFHFEGQTSGGKLGVKVLWAVLLMAAIALPWFALVEMRSEGFLSKIVSNDLVKRTTQGVDGQARPPGFYLLTIWGTFFPYSLFLPAAVLVGWKNRHRPLTRFCLAACLGPWVMFEASTSKMVHWFFPVFVPLSILTADAVVRCWQTKYTYLTDKPFRRFSIGYSVLIGGLGLASWAVVFVDAPDIAAPAWTAVLLSVLTVSFGATTAYLLYRSQLPRAVGAMAGFMLALFVTLYAVVLPRWPVVTLSHRVGVDLAARDPAVPVLMTTYREASLAFYQGGTAREAELAALSSPTPAPVFITITKDAFAALPPETRAAWRVVGEHQGLAYAKGLSPSTVLIVTRSTLPSLP